ncbi:MAG TPA: methionyl-tRNA formyltransferase [Candidatus Acidoferrales bacterium]|nr:methionyl-tRNA formyltransferase [Candidatus Acidoferrales bacterium]
MPLRIVFCGTPAFALPSLRRLIAQPDFRIEAVVTQPDRPRGRGGEIAVPPVKNAAVEAGVAVYQPEKIKSEAAYEFFQRIAPDVAVIIAYGQIVSQRLLDIPRLGWINLHASLLPKYRGAAPINWAIVNGETRTGVTTMQVSAGLDTGPILLAGETDIGPDEAAPELAARLAEIGAPLIVETLHKLDRGELAPRRQDDSQATFAPLLKKEDGRVDWSQPARAVHNRLRGLQPWPGAFTSFRGRTCHIWGRPAQGSKSATAPGAIALSKEELAVACGEGTALRLELVQLEGRKRVTAREFASGARLQAGDRFE